MLFLDHVNHTQASIRETFGAPEYSYFFVRNAFIHIFERLGTHVAVGDTQREVDERYRDAEAKGETCALFSFSPPSSTPLGHACPTLPVFAWEYDTLPDESWNDNPQEDWVSVLKQTGMAITHCSTSADAVHRSLGKDYPVWTIPAPLFERYSKAGGPAQGWRAPFELSVQGGLAVSAGDIDLSLFRYGASNADAVRALRVLDGAAQATSRAQVLKLEGVIYTTVFNPHDGRKNWKELIGGFVWAFRDVPTATLLVKLTRFDVEDGLFPVLRHLTTLGRFGCKIILIHGLLSNEAYAGLIGATSYAVNTAFGEGQCLPLMEYMSAGRPAVAPAHTAMLDYVTEDNSFVIASEPQLTHWPHDERLVRRCTHHRVYAQDLVRQYRQSYQVARDEPERYQSMSRAAVDSQRAFCSDDVAVERMGEVIRHLEKLRSKARPR